MKPLDPPPKEVDAGSRVPELIYVMNSYDTKSVAEKEVEFVEKIVYRDKIVEVKKLVERIIPKEVEVIVEKVIEEPVFCSALLVPILALMISKK